VFTDDPDNGFYVKEIADKLQLKKKQVRRALQFFINEGVIISTPDPYSGFGRVGNKLSVYALSEEAHRKVSKSKHTTS